MPVSGAILGALLCLSAGYALAGRGGRSAEAARGDGRILERLSQVERRIGAGGCGACVWADYGGLLAQAGRHRHAAAAFAEVLRLEPYNRDAQCLRALELARAGEVEPLRGYMAELVVCNAKLADELFARPEFSPVVRRPDFRPLVDEARNQASV